MRLRVDPDAMRSSARQIELAGSRFRELHRLMQTSYKRLSWDARVRVGVDGRVNAVLKQSSILAERLDTLGRALGAIAHSYERVDGDAARRFHRIETATDRFRSDRMRDPVGQVAAFPKGRLSLFGSLFGVPLLGAFGPALIPSSALAAPGAGGARRPLPSSVPWWVPEAGGTASHSRVIDESYGANQRTKGVSGAEAGLSKGWEGSVRGNSDGRTGFTMLGGQAGVGASIGTQDPRGMIGASATAHLVGVRAGGTWGSDGAGLTGDAEASAGTASAGIGYSHRDRQFSAEAGVSLVEGEINPGVNVGGRNYGAIVGAGLKLQLGVDLGADRIKVKLPLITLGLSFGGSR